MASQKTALYNKHIELGGKLVDFAGWTLPIRFEGVIAEHRHCRSACSLFDVSHMGEVFVEGPTAQSFLNFLTINDVTKLNIGSGQYTAMCQEDGGMIDDLILYRVEDQRYLLCVNASNIEKDVDWIKTQAKQNEGVVVENASDAYSQLALQGPWAGSVLKKQLSSYLDGHELEHFGYMQVAKVGEGSTYLARTGYTGEQGFEIYAPNGQIEKIWDLLMADEHVKPAGLGCRDTLRLESCYLLYGQDMNETVTPLEAGIGWATKLDKPDFIGKQALIEQKECGSYRKNIAFKLEEPGIAREDMNILDKDSQSVIGKVTSGSKLPTLDFAGGMGLVARESLKVGDSFFVDVRGKLKSAIVVKKPMYQGSLKNPL